MTSSLNPSTKKPKEFRAPQANIRRVSRPGWALISLTRKREDSFIGGGFLRSLWRWTTCFFLNFIPAVVSERSPFVMTRFLPPQLLSLFQPREPVPFIAPLARDEESGERKYSRLLGLAQDVARFQPEPAERPPKPPVMTKVCSTRIHYRSIYIYTHFEELWSLLTDVPISPKVSFSLIFIF